MPGSAVVAGFEVENEFQGHVEAWPLVHRIQFGPRDVVDADHALADDLRDLLDAYLRGVVHLQRAAWTEPVAYDREHDSVEERQVRTIERGVDEGRLRRCRTSVGQDAA